MVSESRHLNRVPDTWVTSTSTSRSDRSSAGLAVARRRGANCAARGPNAPRALDNVVQDG